MSAPLPSPLSEHTVHVPPRQTCHVTADHPLPAESIVLTLAEWSETPKDVSAEKRPRDALFLGVSTKPTAHSNVSCPDTLEDGATSRTFKAAKDVYVTLGNCCDTPLRVTFEIWGKP